MRPGDVIAGQYEILRLVRSGGVSVVFEAQDQRTQTRVAVKLINFPVDEKALRLRFHREIEILSKLSHPHIVQYLGSGTLEENRMYLVLELLEGQDLAEYQRVSPITLRLVLDALFQVGDALRAAHEIGIIHRDIKPANICLVQPVEIEESVARPLDCRVLDFGVAKLPQSGAALTKAGAILGTPSYMAPEQASYAMDVDARADIFSLGVVAFEMLTGRLPWTSATDLARLARIMVEKALPVSEVSEHVPSSVANLIDQMLLTDVEERVLSAVDVCDRARSCLDELPDGVLDTTFTSNADLLRNFVRAPTMDVVPPSDPVVPTDLAEDDPPPGEEARSPSGATDKREPPSRSGSIPTDLLPNGGDWEQATTGPKIVGPEQGLEFWKPVDGSGPTLLMDGEALQAEDTKPDPLKNAAEAKKSDRAVSGARRRSSARSAAVRNAKSRSRSEETQEEARVSGLRKREVRSTSGKIQALPVDPPKDPGPTVPILAEEDDDAFATDEGPPPAIVSGLHGRPKLEDQLSYVETAPNLLLFGRVDEVDKLRSHASSPLLSSKPSSTLVIGPAGIGKTRLRVELARVVMEISQPPRVFVGRAAEIARSIPFSFLKRVLFTEARIKPNDPPDQQRDKILRLVPSATTVAQLLKTAEPKLWGGHRPEESAERTRFWTAEALNEDAGVVHDTVAAAEQDRVVVSAFLCEALGIPYTGSVSRHAPLRSAPPDARPQPEEIPPLVVAKNDPNLLAIQMQRALDVVLRCFADTNGLVVIIDDAQFLDHSSALVLRSLLVPEREIPTAVVAFALPSIRDTGMRQISPLAEIDDLQTKVVALESLNPRASREFARSLVKGSLESSSLEQLVKRAAGNPLYLEQLVRAVQVTGVLALDESGELSLQGLQNDETDVDRVPPTIAAAVSARLARLEPRRQKVLTAGAVFGDVFWAEGVAQVTDLDDEEVVEALDLLLLQNFVRRRSSTRYHDQTEYEFTHSVIRSVALSRLKRKRRHVFEQRVVGYLESIGETDETLIAGHMAYSGRIQDAARVFAEGAERCLNRGALVSANVLADEGLLLTEGGVERDLRIRLLNLVEQIALLMRDWTVADSALDALEQIAETDAAQAHVAERRSILAFSQRNYQRASEAADEAIPLWQSAGSAVGEARARLLHARASESLGDGRSALSGYVVSAKVFSDHEEGAGVIRSACGLAHIAISSGDYLTAENRFRESLVHASAIHDHEGIFWAQLGLAEVTRLTGDAARATSYLDEAGLVAFKQEESLLLRIQHARLSAAGGAYDDAFHALGEVYQTAQSGRGSGLAPIGRIACLASAQLLLVENQDWDELKRASEWRVAAERLTEAHHSAETWEPSLTLALAMALALTKAAFGDRAESLKLAEGAISRFKTEGAVTGDEPPSLSYAHARVLERTGDDEAKVKEALRSAVVNLDTIASRLGRDVRDRYLERRISKAIIERAEHAGLKLTRDAKSKRIIAS